MRKRNRSGRAVPKYRHRLMVGGLPLFERPLVMEPLEERLALAVSLGIEAEGLLYASPSSPMTTEAPGDVRLSDQVLAPILQQAASAWSDSGILPEVSGRWNQIDVRLIDLPSGVLGQTVGETIQLDLDAAGYGWFVDPTPADNSEFGEFLSDTRLAADASSPAAGRIDLLTVMTHELGHVLGFGHTDPGSPDGPDVMSYFVSTGERRFVNVTSDVPQSSSVIDQPTFQLTDGARLNDVIDVLLESFDTSNPPTGEAATFTSGDGEIPNSITVGTTPAGGADLELEDLTLTFSELSYASDHWIGEVLVESTSGSLIPDGLDIEISDSDDDGSSAVFGTIQLGPGDNSSFLDLDSVNGADIWPSLRWLVTEIEDLRLTFDDFRADDSDSSLEMETNFVGIDTGSELMNALLFQVLTIEGSNSVTFNMDRLSEGTRNAEGKVSYAKSPVSDLSGISGRLQIAIPTVITIGGGFIYKEVGIDADGGIAASANDTVDTIGYLAVKGFLEMARKKKDSEGNPVKDSKGKSVSLIDKEFGVNFAISEKGPLQFFVFTSAPVLLEPITGLSLTQVRGGIRFNSTLEDLQVRDPYAVSEDVNVDDDNIAIASGDLASPVQITLTVPDHNFHVGDEFRIPTAGDPDLVSMGQDRFVVTAVDGNKITYLTGGGGTEPNPANYSFGGTIEVEKISISDPADLRDPGFASTKNLTMIQWEEQLDQQVVNQANAGSWAFLNDDIVLELGATVSFQPRLPESVLKADADVLLDTTGKVLVTGELSLATVVKVPTKIFADLSEIAATGTANMLFLTDLPKAIPGLLEEPLIEIYAGVTFEALRNGVPFDRDITGLPAGVGTNVTGVTIVDLAGTDQGPWEVTLTLDSFNVDTQYAVGDSLVIVGSEPDGFDGTHVVTHVTETTVSFVIGSAIVAGGVDVNRDGTINASDTGSLGNISVIGGRLDMNEDGSVDAADSGEVFDVLVDPAGTRQVVAYPVIDGYVDIDRDGNVTLDAEDNAVIGEDPRNWLLDFVLAPGVVNGQVDIDGDGDADAEDDGILGGVPVVAGRLDMNRSGGIDADDDGEILKVAIDSAGNRVFASYHVIDGSIDIDGDEIAGADDDDDLGVNPSGTDLGAYWLEPTFKAANLDDLGDGLRITVHGGVDLNIPSVTTLSLHGDATLDLVFGGAEDVRIDFAFGMSLSETHVGTIGTANGQFIVTLDHSGGPEAGGVSLPKVEIWGGAILDTNFGFLERVGLYAEANGLLVINSTSEDKDPITLHTTGATATIIPTAQTFALRLGGSVTFRIDFDTDGHFDEDESVFQIGGVFVLEFSAAQGFNVAIFDDQGGSVVPASLTLGPPDDPLLEFGVLGFLAIRSDGFAADLVLTVDAALPGDLASIHGMAVLIVNTTGDDVIFVIPEDVTDPNRDPGLEFKIPKAAPVNPSGILAAPESGPSDSGLQALIGGSPTWEEGPAGPYGVVFLAGELNLLSILELNVSGYILLSEDVVSLEANFSAAGNFLNLASASVHGTLFFSSQGEFVLDVGGHIQLGPDGFNISGTADLEIRYLDDDGRGSQGNLQFVLDISGSLWISAEVFYIPIGPIGVGVDYNSGSGEISISVGVLVPVIKKACTRIPFIGRVCVYYPYLEQRYFSFNVGTLALPQEGAPPPASVLGQVGDDGVLTLNVGPDAAMRNLAVDQIHEGVVIDDVSAGSTTGQKISITMFGVTQTFDNVTKVLIPDMGNGDDFVEILAGVATYIEVHLGDDQDRVTNRGSGVVIAYGDDGDDYLEGGNGKDQLHGGLGDDEFVIGTSDLALLEEVDGGEGDDEIIIVGDDAAQDLRVAMDSENKVWIRSYSSSSEIGSVGLQDVEAINLSGGRGADKFSVSGQLEQAGVTSGVVIDMGSVDSDSDQPPTPDEASDLLHLVLSEDHDQFQMVPTDQGVHSIWKNHFNLNVVSGYASDNDRVEVLTDGGEDLVALFVDPEQYGTVPTQGGPVDPDAVQEVFFTDSSDVPYGPTYSFKNVEDLMIGALVVDSSEDESDDDFSAGDLSLREAIELTNANPGADTIVFATDLLGDTIPLKGGELLITDDLTITGPGPHQLTISGNQASRIFRVNDSDDNTKNTVEINGLSLMDGSADRGGAVDNHESLTLATCFVTKNSATGSGGGIFNQGTLIVTNSTFAENSSDQSGGAIANWNGTASVINSTISKNEAGLDGGGIVNDSDGELLVINATIANNTADVDDNGTGAGGGIGTKAGSSTTLYNTLVAANVRNMSSPIADDLAGEVELASAFNLIGDAINNGGLNNNVNNNQVGIADLTWLAPLGDYGGPTWTIALEPGSPATDGGSNALAVDPDGIPLPTDQRGAGFTRVIGQRVDIGAVECPNQPPTVEAGPDRAVPEYTLQKFTMSFFDLGPRGTHTATIDWGDETPVENGEVEEEEAVWPTGVAGTVAGSHMYLEDGVYTVTVTVTDDDDAVHTNTAKITVENVAPTVVATPSPSSSVQYSDPVVPITITAADTPADTMTIELVTWYTDLEGNTVNLTELQGLGQMQLPDAGTLAGALSMNPVTQEGGFAEWQISGIADLEPGDYEIVATVSDDDGGTTDINILLTVEQEDAVPTYAASLFYTTDPRNPNHLEMELRAVVQDISFFVGHSDHDSDAGEITYVSPDGDRTATVTFQITNQDGPGAWTLSGVPVLPLDADPLTGVSVATLSVADLFGDKDVATTLEITTSVEGFYFGSEVVLVTVAKPDGDFITGGGYLTETDSYGGVATVLDADGQPHDVPLDVAEGSKMNLGFSVKYNKQLTNLQGNFSSILRMTDGTQWKVKSTATRSLGVNLHPFSDSTHPQYDPIYEGVYVADFQSKANLINLDTGESQGGLIMYVHMTDFGEPGSQDEVSTPDRIGFSLWNAENGTLVFATSWNGSAAIEQDLAGGNVQIHTKRLNVANGPAAEPQQGAELDDATLQSVVQEAKNAWLQAGLDPNERELLRNVSVQVGSLEGTVLGCRFADHVWIDRDAAGYGWSIGPRQRTNSGYGNVDLLSVVTHEFGHVLGLDHDAPYDVMAPTLGPNVRTTVSLRSSFQAQPLRDFIDAYDPLPIHSTSPRPSSAIGSTLPTQVSATRQKSVQPYRGVHLRDQIFESLAFALLHAEPFASDGGVIDEAGGEVDLVDDLANILLRLTTHEGEVDLKTGIDQDGIINPNSLQNEQA